MRLWKFIVKWKSFLLLIFIILLWGNTILREKTKAIPDLIILVLIFIAGNFYFNYFHKLNNKDKLKLLVNTQKVCFPLIFVYLIFAIYIPHIIAHLMFMTSIFGIFLSIYLKREVSVNHHKKDTLEEKIKKDLKIYSKVYRKAFWSPFKWVGGFVMPAFPFFTLLNKNWKKGLNKEALIHENIHLYYLQNGFIFVIFFSSLLILIPTHFLLNNRFFSQIITIVYLASTFVFFEYITFRKTNTFAKKFGIKTRKWDKNICLTYFVVYTVQVTIITVVYFLIKTGIINLIRVIL